jgi:N-acylneuraminate cytidylyltransferase
MWPVLGLPIVRYPITAAIQASKIDAVYVTTDSPSVAAEAAQMGVHVIDRPPELATDDSPHGDAIKHGVEQIPDKFANVVVMLGNTVMNTPDAIDLSLDILEDEFLDSVMTVMPMEEHHPSRMQLLTKEGLLKQYLETDDFVSTNRQDYIPAYVFDGRHWTFRKGLEQMEGPLKPWWWLGRRCYPLVGINPPVRDVHNKLEIEISEWWVRRRNGDRS